MEFKWSNINTFKDLFNIVLSIDNQETFTQLLNLKSEGKDIFYCIYKIDFYFFSIYYE